MVYPNYYPSFSCIADACKHNCCIGWEIDIDEDTLRYYDQLGGELGNKLRQMISREDTPHFCLGENDRCPFLQENNLCELILTLGQEHLCQICTDHPRFRNTLPGRVEIGVGLCCEAAGRLILGKKDPTELVYEDVEPTDDEIIAIRDKAIRLLQDRSISIEKRIAKLLDLCGAEFPKHSIAQWAKFLLSLERLEESWTELVSLLLQGSFDVSAFHEHMKERQVEYEQFCVYLAYRHMANAADEIDLVARANFVALGYLILYTLGAALWAKNGSFTFDDQVELARHFSAEIEYSEDNMDTVLDALVPYI